MKSVDAKRPKIKAHARPEKIGSIMIGMATITDAGPAEVIYIDGVFFGKNPPKVFLEYPVYEKDGITVKQIKTLSLKVRKPYTYADYKGNAGKSCMEISSGVSRIAVAMPSKWPKKWHGYPPDVAHNIVIDNKVSKATIEFHIKAQ